MFWIYLFIRPIFGEICNSWDDAARCENDCFEKYIKCLDGCIEDAECRVLNILPWEIWVKTFH